LSRPPPVAVSVLASGRRSWRTSATGSQPPDVLSPGLLAKAVVAYSIHEHQLGHVRRIEVRLEPDRLVVQDDGRGMGLDREGYVAGLLGTLVGGGGEVQLHGIGLSLVAAAAPRLEVESCRDGTWWKQSFERGVPAGPPSRIEGCPQPGTRITLAQLPPLSAADAYGLRAQVDHWRRTHPALTIVIHDHAGPKHGA